MYLIDIKVYIQIRESKKLTLLICTRCMLLCVDSYRDHCLQGLVF